MDPKNILVVGVKGTLIAFEKSTGRQLWSTRLKSSLSSDFVSVVADETQVYAHTAGELFCVNLFTGDSRWSNPLEGMGYGVASLASPLAAPFTLSSAAEVRRQQDAAAASSSATNH